MRAFFAILAGLFFLVFAVIFLFIFNLNKTVLKPSYVENLAEEAKLYDKIPQIIGENILKQGDVPSELQDVFVKEVTSAITPQMVRSHLVSLIDQMLSEQVMIEEDISDLNSVLINKTDLGYLINNSDNSTIPNSITFDKKNNEFGKFILNKNIYILISLVGSIGFLLLIFFVAAKNYKSKFKWIGAFFTVLASLILIDYLVLYFINFQPLVSFIKEENSLSQTLDQVIIITHIVKGDLAKYFLYEFIILGVISFVCFIIASLIHKPPINQTSESKK